MTNLNGNKIYEKAKLLFSVYDLSFIGTVKY